MSDEGLDNVRHVTFFNKVFFFRVSVEPFLQLELSHLYHSHLLAIEQLKVVIDV